MVKGYNQKLKMLYLVKIFSEETDSQHGLTMADIISKLRFCGVNANRKTLYQDFEELRRFGFDIATKQAERNYFYFLESRQFALPEMKLLVDAVQSAKFITDRKSEELIRKLDTLVSKHQAKQLQREVIIAGRVKSINEDIYKNVDIIHEGICSDRQIRFRYYRWNIRKEMELRRNGDWYQVSPWALMWDDENYYMVGYDKLDGSVKHYRVDKMLLLSVTDEQREGGELLAEFDIPKYTKSLFGMFGGEEKNITLEADNSMVGVLIDRFGKDIFIMPVGKQHFRTTVNVSFSRQFLGWIISLGDKVRIISPDSVVEEMQMEIKRLQAQYM